MLGDKPCVMATLFADQGDAGPTVFGDEAAEGAGVVGVDLLQHRVIAAVEAAFPEDQSAGVFVALPQVGESADKSAVHFRVLQAG